MSQRARELDKHVGRRMRERRLMLGLTQADLASALGISYQQAHKYEIGASKVAAGRLYEIAEFMDVPVSYFYERFTAAPAAQFTRNRLCLEVVRNFLLIKKEEHRAAISAVARALAASEASGGIDELPSASPGEETDRPASLPAAEDDTQPASN